MPRSLIKGKVTDREKAKKNFDDLSLTNKVQTNKEYTRIYFPFSIEGRVVEKKILSDLEKDADAIPYLVDVLTESGEIIEINALWLEKIE